MSIPEKGSRQFREKSVTIKDIAQYLGISASSVSRALSDSFEIAQGTKVRVLEAAGYLGYKPNTLAQGLKNGKSRSVGVIIPTIDNPFFCQVINGIDSVTNSRGYHLIIAQSHGFDELEVLNLKQLTFPAIDGLLISIAAESDDLSYLKELHDKGLPIVCFDRVTDRIGTHQVVADNYYGAYEATMCLIKAGYTKIAHITTSENVSNMAERLQGYESALNESHIEINTSYIKYCKREGKDPEEVKHALKELFAESVPPEAILTASDTITTVVLRLLHHLQYAIPQDIALIGFSNTEMADVLAPSLSTIYQPGFEMGEKAAELLIDLIEGKAVFREISKMVLRPQIFVRDSVQRKQSGNPPADMR